MRTLIDSLDRSLENIAQSGIVGEDHTVSQGTLIGLDQLVLGATAACDLLDLDGRVAIPTGTTITPQLVNGIKEAGVVGLVAGRPDFANHHLAARRLSMEAVAARISEMRRRSGIADPLTPSTREVAERLVPEALRVLAGGGLPDLAVLEALSDAVLHDIEHLDTAPLPCLRSAYDSVIERLADGGLGMAILLGWHLRTAGCEPEFVRDAVLGGLLHDVGLLYVSKQILERPSSLTSSEFREIRRHPYLGLRALSPLRSVLPKEAQDVILMHHEREDGLGYPLRRSGECIPPAARLAHILDAYVALISPRPYRQAYSPYRAIEVLLRESGKSYNRAALRGFIQRTGRYPLGSAVVLSSNEVGVVVAQGNGGPFRPVVDIYFSRHLQFSQTARRLDLGADSLRYVRQVMK